MICLFACFTCTRKTTFNVKVYNYALDEPTPNAKVALIERSASSDCKLIASAISDANGFCSFSNERLKKSGKDYFIEVTEAYGTQLGFSCENRTSGFITPGSNKEQIYNTDFVEGFFRIQYNNLLNPSQQGDSLLVYLNTIDYPNPKETGSTVVQGGGGVFSNWNKYSSNNNIPSIFTLDLIKIKAQRLKRYIYKRKMGVVTEKIDTVKVYPTVTTTIVIDW